MLCCFGGRLSGVGFEFIDEVDTRSSKLESRKSIAKSLLLVNKGAFPESGGGFFVFVFVFSYGW